MDRTPEDSSRDMPEGKGFGSLWYILSLGAFLLFYVLSVGPVAWLYGGKRPPAPIVYFYLPLESLADHFPPARQFFEWYIMDLWRPQARNMPTPQSPPSTPSTNVPAGTNSG